MDWQIYPLPFDNKFISNLKTTAPDNKPGIFFKGNFDLNEAYDTYIDMSNYQKGVVWVNGHNLCRYWNVGPQFNLYCPANWLKKGKNEVVVFDLHQFQAATISGVKTLE